MILNKKVIALLPIKDHSERVVGKNFKHFCGKPLYHHIVNTLDRTYAVDTILINTDSPLVIHEASRLSPKIKIIERPEDLCGDYISTNKIFEYDLKNSESDIYIQTHATNPLLKAETIAAALREFVNQDEYDSMFSVTEFKSRFYDENNQAINHNPKKLLRTQDLPSMYEENSCLYIFTRESFQLTKGRIGMKPKMFVTPRLESIDIDDHVTWRIAELLGLHSLT